ncbi:MAG: 50S ribosomal protein L11 methyltransferase [Rhodobacteraceae bacterium]|nr:50S ribosomal protein L11 methyltransferase [Paracoccaceae bacterium]
MPTFTAFTILPGNTAAEALCEALERLSPAPTGVGTFELEDGLGLWEVGGYFEDAPDEVTLALLAAAYGARPFAVSELPETDWVVQVRRELHPVVVGRFFVYGSHDADKVPDGSVPLLIEAAMAFGTGHHGTTQGCLEALEALLQEGFKARLVADIGCGTAILAMAAAKVWASRVIASDIDEIAVDVARANASANGLADRVTCIKAAGTDHPTLTKAAPFALIFANILKGPLITLAPDIARSCAPGGRVILSGILIPQARDVMAVYEAEGLAIMRQAEIGEWATLTLGA